MNFLQQKNVVTADPATHKELLKTIWFNMYSRGGGKISSSGFEHVFMSEIKNGTVIGLHNWMYLADEEKSNGLDYKGWIKKIDLGNVRKSFFFGFFHFWVA
jgi:poly(U)-specific endoribonuclease